MKNKESAFATLIWQALKLYPVETLDQFIKDKNKEVRYAAARRLQLSGGKYAFGLASKLIKSETPSDRAIGVFILGQLDTPRFSFKTKSIPVLLKVLRSDRSKLVKRETIIALGHLSDDRVIDDVLKYKDHPSKKIRTAVASTLLRFTHHPKAQKALQKLRKDKSRMVRHWATD